MRLTGTIHLVGGGSWGGMGLSPGPDCNCYLVECGGAWVLVDTGSGVGASPAAIAANVEAAGAKVDRLAAILLTHMHGDHAGGAAHFARTSGAAVHASALTARVLAEGDEETSSVAAAKQAGIYPADFRLPALPSIAPLADGDVLRFGDTTITTIETPGHCEGHLSFVVAAGGRRDLVAGDAVFWRGRSLVQATADCDPAAMAASMLKLAALPDIDGLFPGHGAFTVSGAKRHLDEAASHARALRLPPGV
jgi:glyoxylase-like metal-dependent hydrolase (beta-lactamase superfamily II)